MNSAVLMCPRCCDHQAKIGITFAQMKALEETNKTVVDSAKKKVRANMRAGWTDEKNARLIKRHETEIKMLERVEDDADKEAWVKHTLKGMRPETPIPKRKKDWGMVWDDHWAWDSRAKPGEEAVQKKAVQEGIVVLSETDNFGVRVWGYIRP
jgi:hypothetical protein